MNRLLDVLGVLLLIGFAVAWWPAALLLSGVFLLSLSRTRRINQQRGGRR